MKIYCRPYILILALLIAPIIGLSQSAPIAIDGIFDDWTSDLSKTTDPTESVSGVDVLEMTVSNDAEWLYINIKTDEEFDLSDDLTNHNIRLYIDTDNNTSTGTQIQQGYGADLALFFKDREVHFNGNTNLKFNDIVMRSAPTVTSNRFEIAIKRDVKLNGSADLFTQSTIKLMLMNQYNNDRLPNVGSVFSYTFDESQTPGKTPISIAKEMTNHVRIVAYNTLFDGLTDASQQAHFENIIKSLKPDIIGFSECNNTTAAQVKVLMDTWLPTGTDFGWYVEKHSSHGLITASRWEIADRWQTLERQFPVLIKLPSDYKKDILFTNAHLKCCTGESQRQEQADSYISFIKDAKTAGGEIDLPNGTPFVYGGDLNLVGYSQQLTTLVTGDIQNTGSYGLPSAPDWDNTDLTDLISLQTENRMSFTWKSETSSFPVGKLDFMLYSDAVVSVAKSFVLRTEIMPAATLSANGLNQNDTEGASDHYPVVADFLMPTFSSLPRSEKDKENIRVYPNPSFKSSSLFIEFPMPEHRTITLKDAKGTILQRFDCVSSHTEVDMNHLAKGIYFITVLTENGMRYTERIEKL